MTQITTVSKMVMLLTQKQNIYKFVNKLQVKYVKNE